MGILHDFATNYDKVEISMYSVIRNIETGKMYRFSNSLYVPSGYEMVYTKCPTKYMALERWEYTEDYRSFLSV